MAHIASKPPCVLEVKLPFLRHRLYFSDPEVNGWRIKLVKLILKIDVNLTEILTSILYKRLFMQKYQEIVIAVILFLLLV